jgi:putative transposase
MKDDKSSTVREPAGSAEILPFPQVESATSVLDQLVREGAQSMLQAALESEVAAFLERFSSKVDSEGRRQVVRNGYMPGREVVTGAGNLSVSQPRVRDKSPDASGRVTFSSSILPPYLRRSKAIDELLPWLYLKGISTSDFSEALQPLTGAPMQCVSAGTIVRLKEKWSQEYDAWNKRDLSQKNYAYIWADGIHVNIRLEDRENQRQCLLVLMGATADGRKELIAVQDGFRESEASWSELLADLKTRGLSVEPQLAIGDGARGFWAAVRKIFPSVREQRCWFHKSGNVLNDLPKSV